jgi:hypothetical protein
MSHRIARHLNVVHTGWNQIQVVHLLAADLVEGGNQEGMNPVDTSQVDMRLMDMSQGDMRQEHHWNKVVAEADIRGRLLRRSLEGRIRVDHHSLRQMGEVEEAGQEELEGGDSTNTVDHSRWDSLCIQGIEQDHPWSDRPVALGEQVRVGRVAEVALAGLESQHRVWLLRRQVDVRLHHHDVHLCRLSSWRIEQ